MWQRSRWEWDRASEEYFVFSAFGWIFIFVLPKKRCSWQPVPYFSLNFWMGEFCLLSLPLKKMRRRSSWEREGASTSLQLASVWRALPVVVVVVDNCLKFLCTWIIVKNSLTFVEKTWKKMTIQNDTLIYCLCSSSAINIDNVTRSSMNERSTGDQTSS